MQSIQDQKIIKSLEIGEAAAIQRMENATISAISALEKLLQYSGDQNMQDTTVRILISFGTIGKTAAEQQMKLVAKFAASVLGKSGNTAALLSKEREAMAVVVGLGEIGKAVTRMKFPDI